MTSSIEWTDETWNFLTGCDPVSPGCFHCYAATMAVMRGKNPMPVMQEKYAGIAEYRGLKPRRHAVFNGTVRFHEPTLAKPLGWKRPRRVFVNSMSDLFHEDVPFELVDRAMAIMAICPQHTFQVLTKRPERQAEYFLRLRARMDCEVAAADFMLRNLPAGTQVSIAEYRRMLAPLPNVWLGTSVEDQQRADERIPHLLRTPAAVRFLSCEPLLGPVDLSRRGLWLCKHWRPSEGGDPNVEGKFWWEPQALVSVNARFIDWVIVGGESGAGARPFQLGWARSVVQQCQAAKVPVFVKQLGSAPEGANDNISHRGSAAKPGDGFYRFLNDRKGGDPAEWPEDLRVRQFPQAVAHV